VAWNVAVFRRGGDARSIPRIRIPGEHTRDRNVLVGRLAEILKDKRPGRVVAAMFLDMAFGSPIYERLRALGFNNVFEVNFGLTHTPDRDKANMRAYMRAQMKDWLLKGAIEADDCDALALTFAHAAVPAEVEERDEDEEFGGCSSNGPEAWMR
jgi:hypothetical protein